MKSAIATATMMLCTCAALAGDAAIPAAQRELIDAELAFVRLAAERGFRDSFFTYFAEDGIAFNPHPFNVKQSLANQPPSGGPMGAVWAPVYGDISRAGDLGWQTGPLVFEGRDGAPDQHGMFFSVWRRHVDGDWRVVLDVGSDTPTAVVPMDTPFQTSFRAALAAPSAVDIARETAGLLAMEREFLAAAASRGAGQAYADRLDDGARVHRPGVMPVVGKVELRDWASVQTATLRGEPLHADVSRSGDLGYAYGSYELAGPEPRAGYYARVWKKDPGGDWRIVMDTISPLPAGVRPLTVELQRAEELFAAQQWAEAARAYERHVRKDPGNAFAWQRLGTSQVHLEHYPDGIRSLEKAIQISGGMAVDFYNLACAYALSGQADKALDNVEKAIAGGIASRRQYESDADLASLRESSRFQALLQRLK
jgi:ketosteroid isomerase-like protein